MRCITIASHHHGLEYNWINILLFFCCFSFTSRVNGQQTLWWSSRIDWISTSEPQHNQFIQLVDRLVLSIYSLHVIEIKPTTIGKCILVTHDIRYLKCNPIFLISIIVLHFYNSWWPNNSSNDVNPFSKWFRICFPDNRGNREWLAAIAAWKTAERIRLRRELLTTRVTCQRSIGDWRQESKKKSRSGRELLDGQQQSSVCPPVCI